MAIGARLGSIVRGDHDDLHASESQSATDIVGLYGDYRTDLSQEVKPVYGE
jgi:hypothetical protein